MKRIGICGSASIFSLVLVAACSSSSGGGSGGSTAAVVSPAKTAATSTTASSHTIQVPADIKSAGVLNIGIAAVYPPYTFLTNGKPDGFEIDIANAVAQKLGVTTHFSNVTFDTLVPGLGSKRFDLATTGIGDTAEREKIVDFVDDEQTYTALIVAKAKAGEITGMDTICGHSAAVPKGTASQTLMVSTSADCVKNGKPAIKSILFPDHGSALLAVESGRADVLPTDLPTAVYQSKQLGDKVAFVDTHLTPVPLGIAVAKTNPALRDAVLAALQQLYSDGDMTKIFAKWHVPQMALPAPGVNLATK